MIKNRPIGMGIGFACLAHVTTWASLGILTYLGYGDAGLILSLILLGVQIAGFAYLNHRALLGAERLARGLRFAIAYLLTAAAWQALEAGVGQTIDLGALEPHSSFFAGLCYVVFWLIWLVALGIVLMLTLGGTLLRAYLMHRNRESKP